MFLSPVPTFRRKKGTEELLPITCAHAEAKEGHREACSCLLCPRWAEEGYRGACSCLLCPLCGARRNTGGTRLVYGKPTLRACTQFINVSQRALHIYWQFSAMSTLFMRLSAKSAANLISYRGVRRITPKVKTVICEQAPKHGSSFAYARLCFRNSQFIYKGVKKKYLTPMTFYSMIAKVHIA